jgi:hypothetical protein
MTMMMDSKEKEGVVFELNFMNQDPVLTNDLNPASTPSSTFIHPFLLHSHFGF